MLTSLRPSPSVGVPQLSETWELFHTYLTYWINIILDCHPSLNSNMYHNRYAIWRKKSDNRENSTRLHNNVLHSYGQCDNCTQKLRSHKNPNNFEPSNTQTSKKVIWISMGLCFSKNTEMYGKRDYPYAQVTPLAIILWYHFFPQINIIIYLLLRRLISLIEACSFQLDWFIKLNNLWMEGRVLHRYIIIFL